MIIIKMTNHDFDLLPYPDVSLKCFDSLIKIYKSRVTEANGDHSLIKKNFYKELNEGQRALFMFYTFYNHACKSILEFYWWSAYFMAQPKTWSAIKAGIIFFDDKAFLQLIEDVEKELKKHNHPDTIEQFQVTRDDLGHNQQLKSSIETIYSSFKKTSPLSISKINNYVEQNFEEFISIQN